MNYIAVKNCTIGVCFGKNIKQTIETNKIYMDVVLQELKYELESLVAIISSKNSSEIYI